MFTIVLDSTGSSNDDRKYKSCDTNNNPGYNTGIIKEIIPHNYKALICFSISPHKPLYLSDFMGLELIIPSMVRTTAADRFLS